MVMMAEVRSRLAALWRRIEDAHYSYLETDDSPEKLQQRKKLEGYITEYLSIVPHECKFGLAQTGKVFQRTIQELPEFSAYRAGLGWAALARYASNLLAQPWRKEYKTIRLYCGYYKHEVEANMVGAETLLHAMGYKDVGSGRLELSAPVCPDTVAAMSRDAIIAETECQIMAQIWESVWNSGARVSWAAVAAERVTHAGDPATAAARLLAIARHRSHALMDSGSEIYSNIPVAVTEMQQYSNSQPYDSRYNNHSMPSNSYDQTTGSYDQTTIEEPITPMIHPQYVMAPNVIPPHMMYPVPQQTPDVRMPQVVLPPYGVPYGVPYYPMQPPYMIPTPVYTPIKQATNIPVNGYPPMPQCRYPSVPTGQLIELDTPSIYENGKYEDRQRKRGETSRRNSTSRSGFSEVSLPSLPRSDTQPSLSKAREDGMGTYESWDYVFRNLSSKDDVSGERSRYSPSLDRDSRTLDRLDKEERRARYQPTTLDLEDGLQALHLDRTYDEDQYRTAKVNENLMRLKLEQEQKRARQLRRAKEAEERRKLESVPNPSSDALVPTKVAPDKVKLLTKQEIKERKDVIKQQNGNVPSAAEARKVKKPVKLVTELDRAKKPVENGHAQPSVSRNGIGPSPNQSYDIKAQLVVSLDEPDCSRRSPKQNGERSPNNTDIKPVDTRPNSNSSSKWQCGTCTYLNKNSLQACEMCGKSKKGPEIQPLTSGGRECPACTLVNQREASVCDACGTSLEHCPTYI